jgi:hypothetical protein
VTTLAEKHIVSIRGILPRAISCRLASTRDFIAQFPKSRGILLLGNLNHSFQYNDYISIIGLWLLHWGRSCCQGITHWLQPWFLGHYALRPSPIHDDFHMVVFASLVTLQGTMDRAHGFTLPNLNIVQTPHTHYANCENHYFMEHVKHMSLCPMKCCEEFGWACKWEPNFPNEQQNEHNYLHPTCSIICKCTIEQSCKIASWGQMPCLIVELDVVNGLEANNVQFVF